jgi:hypothetical protein
LREAPWCQVRLGTVSTSEALIRDAELIALWVLHYGPAVSSNMVLADDSGAAGDELVDERWVRLYQVEMELGSWRVSARTRD